MHLRILILAVAVACTNCRDRNKNRDMELWFWNHSYLVTPKSVAESKARIDLAAKAGYTGVVLWDSSWTFLSQPGWPEENRRKLKEVVDYATAHKLRVLPIVAPYGHSNDMLKLNPNWAEGQRVVGTRFKVNQAGARLEQVKDPPVPLAIVEGTLLRAKVPVIPWRQYRIHLALSAHNFSGLTQIEINDGPRNVLDAPLHPAANEDHTPVDYTFNSGPSADVTVSVGAFGPHTGELHMEQIAVEETALVYVLRGEGAPLRVYDPGQPTRQFAEGRDFAPVHDQKLLRDPEFARDNYHDPGPVMLPAETTLRPGQVVAMDYYAVTPVYDEAVSVCLSEPTAALWVERNARDAASLLPPGSGLFLAHDEIRQMNSCALCRKQKRTAGELLANNVATLGRSLNDLEPLYIWSDMFDPGHNAHGNFFQVEGSLAGSWKGLPPGITVMNWGLNRLHDSLLWFSGDHPQQRVAYRQIIAGFYDPPDHDGASAAHREWKAARGLPGVAGAMYTTWNDDYSQLEAYGRAAQAEWLTYQDSRPW